MSFIEIFYPVVSFIGVSCIGSSTVLVRLRRDLKVLSVSNTRGFITVFIIFKCIGIQLGIFFDILCPLYPIHG